MPVRLRNRACVRVAILSLVIALWGTAFAGVAAAADSVVSASIDTATLELVVAPGSGAFAGRLDGSAQILSGWDSGGFTVTDARGSGAGWQVTMVASRFVHESMEGVVLAPDSLTAPLFTAVKGDPGSSDPPGSVTAAPIDNETGAVVAACTAAGQGMGVFEFSAPAGGWKLAITADDYAGTYSSTITTTVSSLAL